MKRPKDEWQFNATGGNQRVYDAVEADKLFEDFEKKLINHQHEMGNLLKDIDIKEQENQKQLEEETKLKEIAQRNIIKIGKLNESQESELQKLRELFVWTVQNLAWDATKPTFSDEKAKEAEDMEQELSNQTN